MSLLVIKLRERTDADAVAARAHYAAVCRQPVTNWKPIEDTPEARMLMLDFCDPVTGRYGQALGRWLEGGDWRQEPLGERPVLLCYDPVKGRSQKHAQERRHGYKIVVEPAGRGGES